MTKFFKTVAVVTIFSVCEKFLGFLYRIFLSHTIGAEGIGLYQVALSVFALILTFICSGTPITVSRLMTKYRAENKHERISKIITAGLLFTVLLALPITAVFYLFAENFTFLFADERCINLFYLILPALSFSAIYSVLRGVFWGDKDFLPYSVTELLEEICMIIVGILLISYAKSVYQGAYFATLAVFISYLFSFSVALTIFFIRKHRLKNPKTELKPLLKSALPITAMRSANSLAVSLISIILPLRLIASGVDQNLAMRLFGSATGQALPLLSIPTTLIGSFTLVLVPEISENFYRKQSIPLKNDVEKALKISLLSSSLFVPIFLTCGNEIGILIFNSYECGEFLMASSFLVPFMSLSSISTSILNSMGLENKTLTYYVISGVFMLCSVWFLPSLLGVNSLIIGFAFIYGLTTILNLRLLNKTCPIKLNYSKTFLYSILTIIPSIILSSMLNLLLTPVLGAFISFMLTSVISCVFHLALFIGLDLVDVNFIKTKLRKV